MTSSQQLFWTPGTLAPLFAQRDLVALAQSPRTGVHVIQRLDTGHLGLAQGGQIQGTQDTGYALLGSLPPLYPEWLGDRTFAEAHGVRFPYIAGAMANGIATPQMVIRMARAGMLGFYGAAGLSFPKVEAGLEEIATALGGSGLAWGANLIHSPNEPELEARVAGLYIQHGVRCVSASAYMRLTPSIVRYACSGLHLRPDGTIGRRGHVFAKISRAETALQFMNPAPPLLLQGLVSAGLLTADEATLAGHIPLAEDITAEADSGGHTDNRPLLSLLSDISMCRDQVQATQAYDRPIRVGAAGGLGTPAAVAGAFHAGAAYVLTGSVNQSAVESGLSEAGKAMLAKAQMTDVIMAPAADMFELGVEVQVLRRGTMFGTRAKKLHHLYHTYTSLETMPEGVREDLERRVLGASLDEVWTDTARFWRARDAAEFERAQANPRHKMALIFRWYLGKASKWAIDGEPGREADYQIWCGPAMGVFNRWVEGSFLEDAQARHVDQIALNLLEGAAVFTRLAQLRSFGLPLPAGAFDFKPRPLQA